VSDELFRKSSGTHSLATPMIVRQTDAACGRRNGGRHDDVSR
jgi:hypothetical protein